MADKEKKHDAEAIRELKTYVDKAGRRINEFIQIYGLKKEAKFYKGEAVIVIKHPDPNVPADHMRLEFLFEDAKTLKQAFEQFDEVAESEKQRWVKEQHEQAKEAKNKIVGVGGVPRIVGANGRPV